MFVKQTRVNSKRQLNTKFNQSVQLGTALKLITVLQRGGNSLDLNYYATVETDSYRLYALTINQTYIYIIK